MSQRSDQRLEAYQLMANLIERSISEILLPFRLTGLSIAQSGQTFNEYSFFDTFLHAASSFTDSLCVALAKALRTITQLSEIKGTPTATLAPRIRQEVFGKMDAVLAQYIQVVNVLGIKYSETSTASSALTGAVIGKILGGNKPGDLYAFIGAAVGAGHAAAEKQNIQAQARVAAYYSIQSYLKELEQLPETLLDFAVALIQGSAVDFEVQSQTLQAIQEKVLPRVRTASELVSLFSKLPNMPMREPGIKNEKLENLLAPVAFSIFGVLTFGYGIFEPNLVMLIVGLLFLVGAFFVYREGTRSLLKRRRLGMQREVSIHERISMLCNHI